MSCKDQQLRWENLSTGWLVVKHSTNLSITGKKKKRLLKPSHKKWHLLFLVKAMCWTPLWWILVVMETHILGRHWSWSELIGHRVELSTMQSLKKPLLEAVNDLRRRWWYVLQRDNDPKHATRKGWQLCFNQTSKIPIKYIDVCGYDMQNVKKIKEHEPFWAAP